MSKKQDFLKFYMDKKDEHGFLSIKELMKNFDVKFKVDEPLVVFEDGASKNFLKPTFVKGEVDAEVLFSRIYAKNGIESAKYYPIDKDVDATHIEGDELLKEFFYYTPRVMLATNDLRDNNTVTPANSDFRIFKSFGYIFPFVNHLIDGSDQLTGDFSDKAVKQILVMRLLDGAARNNDRHSSNYFYQIDNTSGKDVVESIKTFDYGASGTVRGNTFYNNLVMGGPYVYDRGVTREQLISAYRLNETVNMFLPRTEASEILGSVDFQKEAEELREETGYQVSQELLDSWAKSFDDMAEEIGQ